jgi:hypothetical protein
MTQIGLQRLRIDGVIRKLIAASMAQHVGVRGADPLHPPQIWRARARLVIGPAPRCFSNSSLGANSAGLHDNFSCHT